MRSGDLVIEALAYNEAELREQCRVWREMALRAIDTIRDVTLQRDSYKRQYYALLEQQRHERQREEVGAV